jgi:hypothetical protein
MSVFKDKGLSGQIKGKGLPKSHNDDILQPELYSGHQQPGPADPGIPRLSHNSLFAVGPQAMPFGGRVNGQSGLARRYAGKLGAGGTGTPTISPGFPAGVSPHK